MMKVIYHLVFGVCICSHINGAEVSNYKRMLNEFQTANLKRKPSIIHETLKKCKFYDSKTINDIVDFYILEYKKMPPFEKNIVALTKSSEKEKKIARVKLSIINLMYYNYKQRNNKKAENFVNDLRKIKNPFLQKILSQNDILFRTEEDEHKERKAFQQLEDGLRKLSNKKLTNYLIEAIPDNKVKSHRFRIAIMFVILEKQKSFKITPDRKKDEIIQSIKQQIILEEDYGILKNLVMLLRKLNLDNNTLKAFVQEIFKNKKSSPQLKKLIEQIFYDFLPKKSKTEK